jgi:pyridinium-3,5-bisthiocarboxylic acid mononucleotide nickel chelatase
MTRIAYLDCPSGIAGDMLLSALIDAGADFAWIKNQLAQLQLGEWQMRLAPVAKDGIMAQQLDISFEEGHHHRTYRDIRALLERPAWPEQALAIARRSFQALAEAEAEVHGCSADKVHFHEVGALDSLLDICGVALAMANLEISQVYVSELPLSQGYVNCQHGRLPLPAPAAALLLRGFRLAPSNIVGETITPTGAALLHGCAAKQELPALLLERVGQGAGHHDFPGQPNVLRVLLGADEAAATPPGLLSDQVDVLRSNIDDASGELLGQLWDKAWALGALDLCYTPLLMKKGRPGWELTLIVPPGRAAEFAALVFRHTTTLGLRYVREARLLLPRESVKVATAYGEISVKVSGDTIAPEADEVAAAAAATGNTFKQVYQAALAAYLERK